MKNHKHVQVVCPECKSKHILHDPAHAETYCTRCGLILQDNTLPRLVTYYIPMFKKLYEEVLNREES